MADDPGKQDEDKQAAEAWGRLQPHADRWFDARLDDFIDANTSADDKPEGDDKKDAGPGAGTAGSGTAGSGGAVGGAVKAGKAKTEEGFDWGGFFFGKQSKT